MKELFRVVERQYDTREGSYRTNGREACYQDIYKKEAAAIAAMHNIVEQFLLINKNDNARPALVLKTERRCVYVIVDYVLGEVILLDVYVEEIPIM